MSRFYDMLDRIRERPAMYIGEKSVSLLRGWVYGWIAALDTEAFANTVPPFEEFHDWVALRLGYYESTSGWQGMLLKSLDGDEEKAFDHFFALLGEFKRRKAVAIFAADVDPSRRPPDWVDTEARRVAPWPYRVEIVRYTEDKGVSYAISTRAGNHA